MSAHALSRRAASAGLIAIAALHVVWSTGSHWPLRDEHVLSDAVVGREDGGRPSSAACLAVAGLLGTAAAFVEGHPRRAPWLSRTGAAATVAVLVTRGAFGLAGHTDVLSPGSTSERFRRLDRRVYSPLCLALAALSVAGVASRG